MKAFLLILLLSILASCSPKIPDFSGIHTSSEMILQDIREAGLVVRVATQGKKIKYYKQRLSEQQLSVSQRKILEKSLAAAVEEDREYTAILQHGFDSLYTFSKVCLVPDTLFKSFLNGDAGHCLKYDGSKQLEKWPDKRGVMLASRNDRDDLVLTGLSGVRLPASLPYRKNAWFPVFRKIFQRKKYIYTQIAWYQKQLEAQYIALQIQNKRI